MRDRRVHHRVVAGRAERGARRACDARAGNDLDEIEVDDARAAGGLVQCRDAESRERREVGHSASTTTGSSRWNASA